MAACLCGPVTCCWGYREGTGRGKKGGLEMSSQTCKWIQWLHSFFFPPRWLHDTQIHPPSLSTPFALFLHPMYYSYNLLTLPKYKSVKLFLCVDSQGAWSLVSCLKPIRKCGYDWGCPWGLFLDGFLYYTNILDWLSQPNSWRSNWYSTLKCN